MTEQKISLGKYPYTYARVSVMRASLLAKEDYHRLMKMSLSEVISFLQSTQYKKEIDELAVKYHGVELMEMALNKNLVATWNKLKRISKKEVGILIDAYLQRADLWNIKTILRGLHTETKAEAITSMLLPAGQLSREKLEEMTKTGSVEELIKKIPLSRIKKETLEAAIQSYREKKSITEIENALDREYYRRMLEFAAKIPSEGKLFRQFLEAEMETANILNVLRLKKAGASRQEVEKHIIGRQPFARRLAAADTTEEKAKTLSEKITEAAIDKLISENSIAETELELGKNLLRKTTLLIHQHPLSVDVILGYMFAKELEVRNLKLLLKARQLSIKNEFVEQQIII